MSTELLATIVTVATPLVAVIYWVSKLEGRIDAQEAWTHAIREDVRYIRERLDEVLDR